MTMNRAQRRSARQASERSKLERPPNLDGAVDLGQLGKTPEQPEVIDFNEESGYPEFPINTTAFIRSLTVNGGVVTRQGMVTPQGLAPVMERSQYLDAEQLIEEVAQRAATLVLRGLMGYSQLAAGAISEDEFKRDYMGTDQPQDNATDNSETEYYLYDRGALPDGCMNPECDHEGPCCGPGGEHHPALLDGEPMIEEPAPAPTILHPAGLAPIEDESLGEELTEADRLALGLGPA